MSHGWWPTQGGSHNIHDPIDMEKVNIPEKIALMHSELSEALEHYRNGNYQVPLNAVAYIGPDGNKKPDGFGIELADCMIRILDLAEALDMDMEQFMRIKMDYNKGRPFRHGNKKC